MASWKIRADRQMRLGLDCTASPTNVQAPATSMEHHSRGSDLPAQQRPVHCSQEQAFWHSGQTPAADACQQQPHPLQSPIRQLIGALEEWEASTGAEDYYSIDQDASGTSASMGNPTLDVLGGAIAKLTPEDAAMVKQYLEHRLSANEVANNLQAVHAQWQPIDNSAQWQPVNHAQWQPYQHQPQWQPQWQPVNHAQWQPYQHPPQRQPQWQPVNNAQWQGGVMHSGSQPTTMRKRVTKASTIRNERPSRQEVTTH